MKDIIVPKKLIPLMKAFSAEESCVRTLVVEAANTIYSSKDCLGMTSKAISSEQLEGILTLMKGIDPKDTIEMIYGSQIIASHLLGLRFLSSSFPVDQTLGLKLLRFSNDAMSQLQKKRNGGTNQNITVNYNYTSRDVALHHTIIPNQKEEQCQ